jgi:hypothetical protein
LIQPLLEEFGLSVCNRREATHVRGASRSLIDYLIFPEAVIVTGVRVEALASTDGHRLVSAQLSDLVPLRKKNLKRVRINAPTAPLVAEFQSRLESALDADPNATLGSITRSIVQSARTVFGLKKRARRGDDIDMPVWWSDELDLILQRKRELLRAPFLTESESSELNALTKQLRKLSRLRSREYWNRVCLRLGQEIRQGGPEGRAAWRALGKLLKPRVKAVIAEPAPAKVTQLWSSLWSSKDEEDERAEYDAWRKRDDYFAEWRGDAASEAFLAECTAQEVREAAESFKDHKAADKDGMINEVLKVLPDRVLSLLAVEFTKMLRGDAYPKEWTEAFVVLLFKGGESTNEANYRPITLLSAMFRLFEQVLLTRLKKFLEVHPFIDPQQIGFQSKRSCEELATALRLAIEKSQHLNKSLFLA